MEEELSLLAECIDRLGGGNRDTEAIERLGDIAAFFNRTNPRHIADEEESLFPRLRAHDEPALHQVLDALTAEHREQRALETELADIAARLAKGADTAALGPHLAQIATALIAAYSDHIRIENEVLIAAIDTHLSPKVQAEAFAEMRARRGHDRR